LPPPPSRRSGSGRFQREREVSAALGANANRAGNPNRVSQSNAQNMGRMSTGGSGQQQQMQQQQQSNSRDV